MHAHLHIHTLTHSHTHTRHTLDTHTHNDREKNNEHNRKNKKVCAQCVRTHVNNLLAHAEEPPVYLVPVFRNDHVVRKRSDRDLVG